MGTYWAVPYTSLVEVTIRRWVPSSRCGVQDIQRAL